MLATLIGEREASKDTKACVAETHMAQIIRRRNNVVVSNSKLVCVLFSVLNPQSTRKWSIQQIRVH